MRTRIKEFRKKNGRVSCYIVQELGNDGQFRTIDGGMCDSREEAEKVRKKYKDVGRFVNQFNKKYCGCHTVHISALTPCNFKKKNEEGRD
jgi:hypothetical protein|nr:MAG TPA: hypothetical protein [Caudoviricetes sp.]